MRDTRCPVCGGEAVIDYDGDQELVPIGIHKPCPCPVKLVNDELVPDTDEE